MTPPLTRAALKRGKRKAAKEAARSSKSSSPAMGPGPSTSAKGSDQPIAPFFIQMGDDATDYLGMMYAARLKDKQPFLRATVHQDRFYKLSPADPDDAAAIAAHLAEREIEYSREAPSVKQHKAVIKGLATSTPVAAVKAWATTIMQIHPDRISQMRSRFGHKLPMFTLEFTDNEDDYQTLLSTTIFAYVEVHVEPYRQPRRSNQTCYRCQGKGHKAPTCTNAIRCRFCSLRHDSRSCTEQAQKASKDCRPPFMPRPLALAAQQRRRQPSTPDSAAPVTQMDAIADHPSQCPEPEPKQQAAILDHPSAPEPLQEAAAIDHQRERQQTPPPASSLVDQRPIMDTPFGPLRVGYPPNELAVPELFETHGHPVVVTYVLNHRSTPEIVQERSTRDGAFSLQTYHLDGTSKTRGDRPLRM